MEKTLDQGPGMKNQDENLNFNSYAHDAVTVSSIENEVSQIHNEENFKKITVLKDAQVTKYSENPLYFKEASEKVSPTLLESAFNVMKTLFSPEKAKSKISNSVSQQKSIYESSSNSCHLLNKQKLRTLEQEIEIPAMKITFSEEYDVKDKKQLTAPFLSPLSFDLQSNDDDSFLTTVSYDESFQSAVTHFDEHGEMTVCDNSQDLPLGNSSNSSLENSECCLENTMLKNESASSKEINHYDFSVKSTNADCPYQASTLQIQNFQANDFDSGGFTSLNGISNKLDSYKSKVETENKILNEENQIELQNTEPGIEELVPIVDSSECLSNNVDCMTAAQKSKIFCSEKINGDFRETTNNINTNNKSAAAAEKTILQNSPGNLPLPLFKSDLNEIDEILLALKKGETVETLNFINGKNPDVIYMNQIETQENVSHKRSVSPDVIRLDNFKEFNVLNKCSDDVKEIEPLIVSSTIKDNKEPEKLIEFANLCPKNGLKESVMDSSLPHSVVNITPPSAPCTEKGDESETIKVFADIADSNFPFKHSTPISALNICSMCPSIQTHDMNSLENSQRSDDNIIDELNNAKFGTTPLGEEIFVKNSDKKNSIAAALEENIEPVKKILPSEQNKSGLTSVTENESNKVEKMTEILKENSELLTPSELGPAHETKSDSLDKKEINEETLEVPVFNKTFNIKSESCSSENRNLSKTVETREPVILNQSKNLEISAVANETFCRLPDSEEYKELNLTFSKKTESVKSDTNEVFCYTEPNDTYVKELNKGASRFDDLNTISEKSLGFISDKERSELGESQEVDNLLSPFKEPTGPTYSTSANESLTENINDDNRIDGIYFNNENHSFLSESFSPSSNSGNSSMLKNQILTSSNQITEKLFEKPMEMDQFKAPSEVLKELPEERIMLPESRELPDSNCESLRSSEFCNFSKNIEPDIAQLIEQQFTPSDIAKICDIANLPENLSSLSLKENESETDMKVKNLLSPKSFDFLNNIQGKPTGRDLSRESLYVKFDPLVQPPVANSLIDFTKEVVALAASETSLANHSSSICEELLAISPEKTSDVIVPPLTPLSDRNKRDKIERQKELQNEIYFLKNLYAERERINKSKMEEYESQIAKLTGDKCVMEDKLKEYSEREKSLVKKMSAQTHDIEQLKLVMKEYVKVISLLTTELETLRNENAKQIETLTLEKDSYMNHLQNTEAAFSDVHAKYEKSKKTIESLKKNEVMYRNTISEHAHKMEEYKKRTKEAQEKAVSQFQTIMLELNESKNTHSQEVSRLRAQLKKTELKLEAVQESLDQKIKENEQLTAICDELIEGRK